MIKKTGVKAGNKAANRYVKKMLFQTRDWIFVSDNSIIFNLILVEYVMCNNFTRNITFFFVRSRQSRDQPVLLLSFMIF